MYASLVSTWIDILGEIMCALVFRYTVFVRFLELETDIERTAQHFAIMGLLSSSCLFQLFRRARCLLVGGGGGRCRLLLFLLPREMSWS